MKYIIITGAARGLGRALAETLAADRTKLFLIDKRDQTKTIQNCQAKKAEAADFSFDLAKIDQIADLADQIFNQIKPTPKDSLYLINNAAEVIPLALLGTHPNEELDYEIQTDISAYILLTNNFFNHFQKIETEKIVLSISSGAAKRPLPGAAVYCASKAAIDMFTITVAKEQKDQPHPIKIAAVTPGVIDTGMQVDLRSADKADFPIVNQFKALHKTGLLQSPEYTARKIAKIFTKKKFPHGKVVNFRIL